MIFVFNWVVERWMRRTQLMRSWVGMLVVTSQGSWQRVVVVGLWVAGGFRVFGCSESRQHPRAAARAFCSDSSNQWSRQWLSRILPERNTGQFVVYTPRTFSRYLSFESKPFISLRISAIYLYFVFIGLLSLNVVSVSLLF